MEHQQIQQRLARFKDKLLDNVDSFMFVLFGVFTIVSLFQEKSIPIWLPIFITTLACFVLRVNSVSNRQYNSRKVILLLHLLIYYLGFLMLHNLMSKTPSHEKEIEEVTVLIYVVFWFFIGSFLDLITRFWLTVISLFLWISTTFGLVIIIFSYGGFLKEEVVVRSIDRRIKLL